MAVDGLTTLTSLLQSDRPSATSQGSRTAAGPMGANVLPLASAEVDIVNRSAATYSGLINPKKGSGELDDDAESYVTYYEREEQEEHDSSSFDWEAFEEGSWEEEFDEDEEDETLLRYKRQKGMFVDLHV